MPQADLPPRCCGRCKNGRTHRHENWRGYVVCVATVPSWVGRGGCWIAETDGTNCPVFEPKEQNDA